MGLKQEKMVCMGILLYMKGSRFRPSGLCLLPIQVQKNYMIMVTRNVTELQQQQAFCAESFQKKSTVVTAVIYEMVLLQFVFKNHSHFVHNMLPPIIITWP